MRPLNRTQSYFVILLALIGASLSLLTVIEHISLGIGAEGFEICSISSTINCAAVLGSRFSEIFGVPIGCFGFVYYLVLMFLALFARKDRPEFIRVPNTVLLFLICVAGVGSLFLFVDSVLILEAICPLCFGTYLVNLTLFCFYWWLARGRFFRCLKVGMLAITVGIARVLFAQKVVFRRRLAMYCALLVFAVVFYAATVAPLYLSLRMQADGFDQTVQPPQLTVAELYKIWRNSKSDQLPVSESGILAGDFSMGPEKAALQIVEFSDFECPFCQRFSIALDEILRNNQQRIHFTFKNFPLDKSCNKWLPNEMHKFACAAAEAARCAGEQGKFFEYANFLFTVAFEPSPTDRSEFDVRLQAGASQLGLDQTGFASCLTSARHKKSIERDIQQGLDLKLEGTPTIWINGRRLTAGNLQQLVELLNMIIRKENKVDASS